MYDCCNVANDFFFLFWTLEVLSDEGRKRPWWMSFNSLIFLFFFGLFRISFPACSFKPVPSFSPVITWCSQRSTIHLWLCLPSAPLMMKSTQVWPSVSNEIEFWSTTHNFHCKAKDNESMFYSYLDFIEFHVSRMTDNTPSVSVGFTWVNKAKAKLHLNKAW